MTIKALILIILTNGNTIIRNQLLYFIGFYCILSIFIIY